MVTTGSDEREIVVSRLIDAPRELVFEAFTQVRHLSRWWGPDRTDYPEWIPTKAVRDEAVEKHHAIEGGEQTLGHLAAYVAGLAATGAEGGWPARCSSA